MCNPQGKVAALSKIFRSDQEVLNKQAEILEHILLPFIAGQGRGREFFLHYKAIELNHQVKEIHLWKRQVKNIDRTEIVLSKCYVLVLLNAFVCLFH